MPTSATAGTATGAATAAPTTSRSDRRGIQLYTLRDAMTNQAEATSVLNALGRMGYTEVETAGHYDWTAKQFRLGAQARRPARRLRP